MTTTSAPPPSAIRPAAELPLAPASTVACLRPAPRGLEVLLLQRASNLAFHGGAWVFPGGRVDPEDVTQGDRYEETAARAAAVRESLEEADLRLAPSALLPLSHWTTPPGRPRRFATWFFLAAAEREAQVRVDGGEIIAHRWLRPAEALAGQASGELTLPPPTFVTLVWLTRFAEPQAVLDAAHGAPLQTFVPRPATTPAGVISLYEGDAGYATRDPEVPGPRHRLRMGPGAWRYQRDL